MLFFLHDPRTQKEILNWYLLGSLGSHCQCAITVILIFNQVLLLQSEDPFQDKAKSRNEAIIHHWNHKFRHSPFAVDAMLRGNIDSTCVDKINNCKVRLLYKIIIIILCIVKP